MKIARTIKRDMDQKIAETYMQIKQLTIPDFYDLDKEGRKINNFYKHRRYMDVITTPNEVIEWAKNHKCPICKQTNYDTELTWDYKEFYQSEIWCNLEEVNHYLVVLKFEDPKNLWVSERSFSIGENGTDIEFYYADYSTKLIDVKVR